MLLRSVVNNSIPTVEQGLDDGEVGATPAQLVNGGLSKSDLLYIVLFALASVTISTFI